MTDHEADPPANAGEFDYSPFKPGSIQARILDVLRRHPDGISEGGIREELGISTGEQVQLGRRRRDLNPFFDIEKRRRGLETLYILLGRKPETPDADEVDEKTRAEILHLAGGRCQMCGMTIENHGITLQVDHRVPKDWGGLSEKDNLWALCEKCNRGKKSFFESVTDPRLRESLLHGSIHIRLGELLKAFDGKLVPKEHLHFVAAHTHEDWEKRLRELRVLGWRYEPKKRKRDGRIRTSFVLLHWEPWPDEPARAIREAERRRKSRR